MELSYSSIINVPQAYAFEQATNFARFEDEGFGKLAPFERRSEVEAPNIGTRWRTASDFQGRARRFSLELLELKPSESMILGNKSEKYDIEARFSFAEHNEGETEFTFKLVAKAQSITARLILQTIQLARGRLESSMRTEFENMGQKMEDSYFANQ